jgi:hypothetical protein
MKNLIPLLLALAGLCAAQNSAAQAYPTKPVRTIDGVTMAKIVKEAGIQPE